MKKLIYRLGLPVAAGFATTMAFLFAIVALSEGVVRTVGVEVASKLIDPMLIAYTFAQTAPETIDEMNTAVTSFATQLIPAWLLYAVFALIAALAVWLIGRVIRAMKSA